MVREHRAFSALTVEDDTELRRSIVTYLEDSGFIVYEASNCREGIDLFRRQQPDIVFTDLNMPQGHGHDLIHAIRRESPHTPIVVVSGTGVVDEAVEAMRQGAWDYITKPVRDLSVLDTVSRRLIERSRQRKYSSVAVDGAPVPKRNRIPFCAPFFGDQAHGSVELETNLRYALERKEFALAYQPQIDVVTGRVTGVETLLRWQRNNGTLLMPSDFIPVLEASGLIIPVGEWILRSACSQYVAWRNQGVEPISLSVNISAAQFKSGGLPALVIRIIRETGMDPGRLCLELTENIVMDDIGETIRTLRTLRDLGISLSLDDFGTGYSSLNYLGMMPISELKIDRSFVAALSHDRNNNAVLVDTIISMAHCMSMRVVAEGVENESQLDHLSSRQCGTAQGFHFSRPLPAEEMFDYLSAYGKPAAPFLNK